MGTNAMNFVNVQHELLLKNKMRMFGGRGCIIYTAGSYIYKGRGSQAGIGVYWPDEPLNNISVPLLGQQTIQRAEVMAAIIGINEARLLSYDVVGVMTSSDYIKNAVERSIEEWERSGWEKPKKNKQDFKDLRESMKLIKVYFEKVSSLSNESAKQLAREAAEELRVPSSIGRK